MKNSIYILTITDSSSDKPTLYPAANKKVAMEIARVHLKPQGKNILSEFNKNEFVEFTNGCGDEISYELEKYNVFR